jgi:DNA repair protein RadD
MSRPTLRPDQSAVLAELYAAIRSGCRRPLVQAPTGWGKGTFAAHVLADVASSGKRGAFVCHREEINLDIAARLERASGGPVRIEMGDRSQGPTDAPITVYSVQTLDARDITRPDVDVWWWDECHRAAAPSYERARLRHANAYHIGSTATPARADGRPLTFFERIIQGPQVRELLAIGALAPLDYRAPNEALEGLAAAPEDAYPAGRPGVVFAANRNHGQALRTLMRRRGIRAEYLDGDTPARHEHIEAFNAGRVDVLICFRLLSEGVDLPRAEVCMFASRIGSVVTFLQAIGRVRRPREGKRSLVLDLSGSLWLHGHPDADRAYSLGEDGPAIRLSKGALLSCVQCPGCLGWGPAATICDACGHTRPAPRAPRMTRAELREQRLDSQPRAGADYELWSTLVRTQRERGYRPQWAAIQFKQQTGHFPRWGLKQVPEVTQ